MKIKYIVSLHLLNPDVYDLTLRPSRVYSFLMWYCMSSETSSKKRPKLRRLLRCKMMVLLNEGLLFFTSVTLLLYLWWWMWRLWPECASSGLIGPLTTYWCGWWWWYGAWIWHKGETWVSNASIAWAYLCSEQI